MLNLISIRSLRLGAAIALAMFSTGVVSAQKPVIVALSKADSTLAIIDPATMKVTARVPTGANPHEVVFRPTARRRLLRIMALSSRAIRCR